MRTRQLIPARTAEEQSEADAVFAFATQRNIRVNPSKTVKARVRCNQLTVSYGVCDFETFIEARADEIERNAKRTLFAHLRSGHPYLSAKEAHALADRASVAIRDVVARVRGTSI